MSLFSGMFHLGHNQKGFLSLAEVYSVSNKTWSSIADLPRPSFGCSGAFFLGHFTVVGGDSGEGILTSVLQWHEDENRWVELAPIPKARAACGVACNKDRMVVVGGFDGNDDTDSVFVFEKGAWRTARRMPFRSSWCSAAWLDDDLVSQ